ARPPGGGGSCSPEDVEECESQGKECRFQNGQGVCAVPGSPEDPCEIVECPAGFKCVVVPVYCFRSPCVPPEAECVPEDRGQ
ncbi:hypothetical protein AAVH_23240, partial [Aphelenchoides avenae]